MPARPPCATKSRTSLPRCTVKLVPIGNGSARAARMFSTFAGGSSGSNRSIAFSFVSPWPNVRYEEPCLCRPRREKPCRLRFKQGSSKMPPSISMLDYCYPFVLLFALATKHEASSPSKVYRHSSLELILKSLPEYSRRLRVCRMAVLNNMIVHLFRFSTGSGKVRNRQNWYIHLLSTPYVYLL